MDEVCDTDDMCLGFDLRDEASQCEQYELFIEKLPNELERGRKYHEEVYENQEYVRYDISLIVRKDEPPLVLEQIKDYLVPDECVIAQSTTRFQPSRKFRRIISEHLKNNC